MKFITPILIFILNASLALSQPCARAVYPTDHTLNNFLRTHSVQQAGNLQYGLGSFFEPAIRYVTADGVDTVDLVSVRGLLAGGVDASDGVHFAASVFSTGGVDFYSGPLVDPVYGTDLETCTFFGRAWKVSAAQIADIQNKFAQGDLTVNDIPINILEWPAKGNHRLGDFAPDYDMAPFYDENEDGNYDPMDGDHPIALVENPAFIPLEMIFTVYNGSGGGAAHGESGGFDIRMEFHQVDFVTRCASASILDHGVFSRIRYIYKDDEPLFDFKMGLFQNQLFPHPNCLGGGFSEELGAGYNYYWKDNEGCAFFNELEGALLDPGHSFIAAVVHLDHEPESSLMYYDLERPRGKPRFAGDYHNLLSARWLDGESLVEGGIGYPQDSLDLDTTVFAFSDFPDDPDGWSMANVAEVEMLNHHAVTNMVSVDTLLPGDVGSVDFADFFYYDRQSAGYELFGRWPQEVRSLRAAYENILDGNADCLVSPTTELSDIPIHFSPNPVGDKMRIEVDGPIQLSDICIYNMQGMRISNIEAYPHSGMIELDVSGISPGMYLLRLLDAEDYSHKVTQFVKM